MKYPNVCSKYGHDHTGSSNGYIFSTHTEQCKNFRFWPFGRCRQIQTLEESILEANGGIWPESPKPAPLLSREIIVNHVYECDKGHQHLPDVTAEQIINNSPLKENMKNE